MRRLTIAAAMASSIGAGSPASAQERNEPREGSSPALESITAGKFLPLAFSPRIGAESGFAAFSTSYEGAGDRSVVEVVGEARLLPWLAVRTGIAVRSSPDEERPLFGVRAQILEQASHGVDGSVGLSYEPDGIREAEGRVSLTVALARRIGLVDLLTSVGYGQDPENDDRQVDARAAALVGLTDRVHAGLAARVRGDLFSDDPKRRPGEPNLELAAGPLTSLALGSFALFAQAGISSARVDGETENGLLALGGVGASF